MYQLHVSTKADYIVAKFFAGTTMREANAVYSAFLTSGLYRGYCLHIVEV